MGKVGFTPKAVTLAPSTQDHDVVTWTQSAKMASPDPESPFVSVEIH